jgi:hypothetical protein
MITGSANAHEINGQLRIHPANPRYFTDDSGDAIYLTCSHMWNNLVDEGGDKDWNWWVVNTVHGYEKVKPKQHPVGITRHGAERLPSMLASPADWVSPGRADGYAEDPPAWDGKKVSLLDTDHVWGVGGNHAWVWKSFVRGHNPLFIDSYDGKVLGELFDPKFELLRLSLGYSMRYAKKMNMAEMIPRNDLASTQPFDGDAVLYLLTGEMIR